VTDRDNGDPRRVGFELEFTGLTLDQTIEALQSSLGGELRMKSAAEQALHVEALGTFNIELDWQYLKRKAAQSAQEEEDNVWIDLLSQVTAELMPMVPMEVVCPPIPMTDLEMLEPMITALRKSGAVGTEDSPFAAYGVHINAEISRLDAVTVFSYLRAFALLQWWLVEAHEVDLSRKLSPYVDLYPEAYLKQLLSQSEPTMD
jgi:hypothetical protein